MTKTEVDHPDETRAFPRVEVGSDNSLTLCRDDLAKIQGLLGMRTREAAEGTFYSALEALGVPSKDKAQMVAAMFAELEPRDGIEAMLIGQMTATHVAMTVAASKMAGGVTYTVRESHSRVMARLGRTYLAQMDALKKYRAKAQQVVRVERVTVNEGGKAIVGEVHHGGGV